MSEAELTRVSERIRLCDSDHAAYCNENPSRPQEAASQFDADSTLEELRQKLLVEFVDPPPSKIRRKFAARMKQVAILVLRLAADLQAVIIRKLIFEEHFLEMDGEFAGCLMLYVPPSVPTNGVARTAVLSPEFSRILRIFVKHYRAALDISGSSPYLFPSVGEKPLTAISISNQQVEFLESLNFEWLKPSDIRKLSEVAIFDANPEALLLFSATHGLRDQEYIKKLAAPFKNDEEAREVGQQIASGKLK